MSKHIDLDRLLLDLRENRVGRPPLCGGYLHKGKLIVHMEAEALSAIVERLKATEARLREANELDPLGPYDLERAEGL